MLGRGSLVLARLRFSRALAVHATCKHVRATTLVVASYHTCAPHVLKPKTWHAVSGRVGRLIPNYSTSQTAVAERSKAPLQPGLYLVGTPIGNLEDLTVRALRVLQTATVVLAEDTRHSRKLLNHYKIDAHLHSFHQHNEYSKQDRVLDQLSQGASVALISDAGMPLISDPGSGLVAAAAAAGHRVIPIAGPSAFLLALVASGLSSSRFTFVGFLPEKAKARKLELRKLADLLHTLVFYVPPHDLLTVLKDTAEVLGEHRQCVVARELTKVHEEFVRCSLQEAVNKYGETAAKGEITLLIEGAMPGDDTITSDELRQQLVSLIASGQSTSSAAKIASKQLGVPRREAYALALEIQATDAV
ncbi:hypothetical protein ABBQ38_003886 [Trebouxia sp. C0009 RCD-2024]